MVLDQLLHTTVRERNHETTRMQLGRLSNHVRASVELVVESHPVARHSSRLDRFHLGGAGGRCSM